VSDLGQKKQGIEQGSFIKQRKRELAHPKRERKRAILSGKGEMLEEGTVRSSARKGKFIRRSFEPNKRKNKGTGGNTAGTRQQLNHTRERRRADMAIRRGGEGGKFPQKNDCSKREYCLDRFRLEKKEEDSKANAMDEKQGKNLQLDKNILEKGRVVFPEKKREKSWRRRGLKRREGITYSPSGHTCAADEAGPTSLGEFALLLTATTGGPTSMMAGKRTKRQENALVIFRGRGPPRLLAGRGKNQLQERTVAKSGAVRSESGGECPRGEEGDKKTMALRK